MPLENDSPTIERLQREIAALQKEKESYRRLASFPQTSPVPVFEFEPGGRVIYKNAAAQQLLERLGLRDERMFLPLDLAEIYSIASSHDGVDNRTTQFMREVCVNDHVYQETVVYSPEYGTLRIFANDISPRRKTEEELKAKSLELMQTQEFIEAVTKGNDVIIATIDTNYCYTYFNRAYQEEMKRLSGTDICLGMNMLDAFAHQPELQKMVKEEWSEVLGGESTNKIHNLGVEARYRKVYNVLHTPIWGEEHEVAGAGEVAYNITEQYRAQDALRDSEARYRSLFDGMTEGFAIHELLYDENGKPFDYRFLDINPAFERLTGLKREDVVSNTYRQVLPSEGDKWIVAYSKVVLTGESVHFEEFSASLDRYYEIYAYRYAENQFATVFMDVTEHKKMENELRINLTKYSVLFDSLPVGVTVSDHDGKILESNPEAVRILGLAEAEHKKRMIDGREWKIVRPDYSPMPADEYASVRALQNNCRVENVEMGILKDDDQPTWISVTAVPIPLAGYGVVIAYNDISKRIQAEEALRLAHDKLEQIVMMRTQELRNTNDELRVEIAERKRIESELLKQTRAVEAERKRFNDVLEILPVYTILLTPDYHVSFTNQTFRERFGEHMGRHCYEFLFQRESACPNCETFKVLQNGSNHHWEWIGPDNHNYDIFDYPFRDVDGSDLILELGIDVTERKQAEDKLRSLNAYNRSLLEASLDALVTITPEGKIGDVNAVTEAITGCSREVLVGTDFHSYFTDPEKARLVYGQVFETGTVRDYELEIQHCDGHVTPVIYNASVFKDEAGNVVGVFADARDISERKQSERQLILLTTALEEAANGITLVDKNGTIRWANPAFSRMTGYSKQEIVGQNPRLLKSGVLGEEFYRNLWETILAGKVWRGEMINRRKNGSLYTEEQVITPVFDQAGAITNFISIRQDITEHKQSEEALRKSEEQYRSLVIATAQIVWQTNARGEVIEDIPTWREYTGQSIEELMGSGWVKALHPEDQERVSKIWAQSVETKSIYETEYRIRNSSGEYGDFSVRGVPILDGDGNVSSWIGTCTDITDKKNVEKQLIQFEKHAVIGRMVGSVTHEINNPLQTIKNCLFLIKQDMAPDSPDKEPLDMALSETQRLANIVGQLRQLYRPQALQTMLPHNLPGIIDEVHSLVLPHLNNAHVEWKSLADGEPCSVCCVKEQLVEVFLNICLNAVEAMQSIGGGTLSVSRVYSLDRSQVGVVFSDTGPGISPEILPHIFEPFITTKEYGLGLGLSICYGIIQKHGGQITVESQQREGSSFTIWLPLVRV